MHIALRIKMYRGRGGFAVSGASRCQIPDLARLAVPCAYFLAPSVVSGLAGASSPPCFSAVRC